MSQPFLGEIRLFCGNFAPRGWALCDGQLMAISQATALFSLLGTTYGGNGTTDFALPNFQDRVPMHYGQGPGLSDYFIGQAGGSANETVTISQLPAHVHPIGTTPDPATTGTSTGGPALAVASTGVYGAAVNMAHMGSQLVGLGQPHSNAQPYLGLNFIIALQGIFPARN
jgi:microcystin-dependent protein